MSRVARHTAGPWVVDDFCMADGHKIRVGTSDGTPTYYHRTETIAEACISNPEDRESDKPFISWKTAEMNARLMAAAPDLLAAQTMGAEINTPDFLDWIADRLTKVHGESPMVDYVQSLRARATAGRAAIAKAEGRS